MAKRVRGPRLAQFGALSIRQLLLAQSDRTDGSPLFLVGSEPCSRIRLNGHKATGRGLCFRCFHLDQSCAEIHFAPVKTFDFCSAEAGERSDGPIGDSFGAGIF